MRKNYLLPISTLLLSLAFFYSCQKEVNKSSSSDSIAGNSNRPERQCRLVYHDWPTAASFQFDYNDKGLADNWIVDLGYGTITNSMEYDNDGRLIHSTEDFLGEPYEYDFVYTGKTLTHITRTPVNFPEFASTFELTYNNKGENTRQDDDVNDIHVLMEYDVMGNCTKTSLYFGTDLYFTDEYTFNLPARNPRAAVPGVTIGFPFYGTAGFPDKRTFSGNRTTIYDNGVPFLWNDYDPAQTTINAGNHNYPVSADYYDIVTDGNYNLTYEYENCNGNSGITRIGNQQNSNNVNSNKVTKELPIQLLRGSAKSIKEKIDGLRKQNKK
jgi:hypothetical protein